MQTAKTLPSRGPSFQRDSNPKYQRHSNPTQISLTQIQ